MKKKMFLVFLAMLLAGCAPPPQSVHDQAAATSLSTVEQPTVASVATEPPVVTLPEETTAATEVNCGSPEVNDLAESMAQDYDFTSREEIMDWFCSGAEFEDILLALETEAQAGLPAEDALSMLVGGMSWEEIWQDYGLTE